MASGFDFGVHTRPQIEIKPDSEQENLAYLLLNQVKTGKVRLEKGSDGRVRTAYEDDKIVPLNLDVSCANTIQKGKNKCDSKKRVNVCLQMIDLIKKNRSPSGVAFHPEMTCPSPQGDYREGKDFHILEEILGSGSFAGEVLVAEDIKTGHKNAMKTVMLSEFRTDEIRCWMDLDDSDSFPKLYLFRLSGKGIVINMEIIENSVSMEDLIKEHIWNLKERKPELLRPFSMYIFHDLLRAVKEMHERNWTHNDLHGGNVMLTKDTMLVKVLDFGMAKQLRVELGFNAENLKKDLLCVIRLFCGLYLGDDFSDNFEQSVKSGSVKETIEKAQLLSREDKQEVFELVKRAYEVATCKSQEGYGDPTFVMKKIESSCNLGERNMVMKMAAAVLFPAETWARQADDVSLHAQQPTEMEGDVVTDGPGDEPEEQDHVVLQSGRANYDIDIEEVARKLSDDVLEKLCLKPLDKSFC